MRLVAEGGGVVGIYFMPFLPDLQGPDQFRKLAHLMEKQGLSDTVIEKVLGLNFMRLVREVWGR